MNFQVTASVVTKVWAMGKT